MVEPSIQVNHLTTDDRGDLDLCKQIETKDEQIKKLCADVGSLEFQISDYKQIVKELSDKLNLIIDATVISLFCLLFSKS